MLLSRNVECEREEVRLKECAFSVGYRIYRRGGCEVFVLRAGGFVLVWGKRCVLKLRIKVSA